YIAVNVSSPNTPGLRLLQEASKIHSLVSSIKKFINQKQAAGLNQGKQIPLFVKFSPDMNDAEFQSSIEAVMAAGGDGLILTNTTVDKSKVTNAAHQEGGISGVPVRDRSTELIRRAYRLTEGRLPIIGVGGIFSGQDALQKIKAGASLVQVYTGYIYQGPSLPMQICRFIDNELKRSGKTIDQLVGSEG
ncbi:MAG: quinone-dependent dihydroorotate dehydrogenase, partial [Leptonema sp. (in: Bacteria)]|nr:quinone-dependent dihydroorotate dehydrogenase [Leptonema sp. (in: bacteria)]